MSAFTWRFCAIACTAEVRQPTFGVAREEHVRLPLAVALRSPVVVGRLRMTTHGIRPARALPDVVGGRAPPTESKNASKPAT